MLRERRAGESRRADRPRRTRRRVQLNEFDTTKRGFFAGVYTVTFHGGGSHELRGGGGFDHTVNDVRKAYPGGRVQVFWDQAASLPNGSTPHGQVRLLHG